MTWLAPDHTGHAVGSAGWSVAVPLALILAVVYVLAAVRVPRWSSWRTLSWLCGCGLVAVAGSPLLGSHADPRAHVLTHLLLGMFAPLALVLASPVKLFLRACPIVVRRGAVQVLGSRPARALAHPALGLALSVGGLYAVMLSPLYAPGPWAHQALQLHYLAAGCLLTWSIAGTDSPRRARMATRVGALVVAAAGHAVLAKHLYAQAERMAGELITDPEALRAAAVLMYYGADLAELLLAIVVFRDWHTRRVRRWRANPAGREAIA